MIRKVFNEVVQKVPQLVADGLVSVQDASFAAKRQEFLNNAIYLQQTNDALTYLQALGKSTRFSQWQRSNCSPQRIQPLVEWHAGRPVCPGAIVIAALHLGFTMGVQDDKVYFNFLSRQIEMELMQHHRRQLIKKVVGA